MLWSAPSRHPCPWPSLGLGRLPGTVVYGCVFSIFRSVNSETEAGPNEGALMTGYYAVPVGCTYNEEWIPK